MALNQSSASSVAAVITACAIVALTSGSRVHSQSQPGSTSPDGLWQTVDVGAPVPGASARQVAVPPGSVVRLNRTAFEQVTAGVRETAIAQGAVMNLPMPDGSFARFRVVESPILDQTVAPHFPEIRTYRAQGIDDPTATARFGWTPAGFHAIVLSASGTSYIDPNQPGDLEYYRVVQREALPEDATFICLVAGSSRVVAARNPNEFPIVHGATKRTYRMAIAATAEYTALAGGVGAAVSQIAATMNRVNGIFEREIAVTMTVVTGTAGDPTALIFTNSATDPYTNGDPSVMLGQNRDALNGPLLGAGNYDVGHVFGTMPSGGSGIAYIGVPCDDEYKGQGVSNSATITGDFFAVELVAHEIGHQFGANHTFNGSTGSCSGGSRNALTAYEVGSGVTIMSYSGSCGVENTTRSSLDQFHFESIDEMTAYITSVEGGACAAATASGNTPPSVSGPGNFTIPIQTPFQLTATGSDADGDSLTYTWEQLDLGAASSSAASASTDNGDRPLFRTYLPDTSPTRTFPSLAYVLANANAPPQTYNCSGSTCITGEVLPSTNRSMTFQVTARDNRAGAGGVATASSVVTTSTLSGPFSVSSPNTTVSYAGNSNPTVTWNRSGTHLAPVSAANVKISLSTDGGATFPTVLAASTPNDGLETVLLPAVLTSTARIKVEAVGNIFFDVSDTNFSITTATVLAPTAFSVASSSPTQINLLWTDNAPDESSYRVERAMWQLGVGPYTEIASLPAGSTSFSDTGLLCNTAYYYRIRAHRSGDNMFSDYVTWSSSTQACPTPSLTAVSYAVAPNGSTNWRFINAASKQYDWWGVFPTGAADSGYCKWGYLSGTQTPPPSALTDTTFGIAMTGGCATAGSYEVRWFLDNGWARIRVSYPITVGPFVGASPGQVTLGGTASASFMNGPGLAGDWWGVFRPGAADTDYCYWAYMNGQQTRPASGLTGAALQWQPTGACGAAGDYEVRWFRNDTYVRLATSNSIVRGPDIRVTPTAVGTGRFVTLSFVNGPGNVGDWWGVYRTGAADSAFCDWGYMNGLKTRPATGMSAGSPNVTMSGACGTTGSYEVRWFANDTFTRLRTSTPFTVGSSVTVSPAHSAPGATIVATFVAGPSSNLDWWGIFKVGDPDSAYCTWGYMNGPQTIPAGGNSGAQLFIRMLGNCLAVGTFEIRWFSNNSLTRLATSNQFTTAPILTVSSASVPAGSNVTIGYTYGWGKPTDWCGLYDVGAPVGGYLSWWYLNGTQTPPASGVVSYSRTMSMPGPSPRSLEVRCYIENSSTLMATSPPISVTP